MALTPNGSSHHWFFDRALPLLLLGSALFLVWMSAKNRSTNPTAEFVLPATPQSAAGTSALGNTTAPVGIIMFTDFQCDYCRQFSHDTLPLLKQRYLATGRALLVFRHRPLSFHRFARDAALAAECAAGQGKFWEAYDQLFVAGRALDRPGLTAAVSPTGIDLPVWQSCMDGGQSTRLAGDMALARTLRIPATPFFLIGPIEDGEVRVSSYIDGARPIEDFAKAIDVHVTGLR